MTAERSVVLDKLGCDALSLKAALLTVPERMRGWRSCHRTPASSPARLAAAV